MKKIVITSKNTTKLNVAKKALAAVLPNEQFDFVVLGLEKEGGEPIGKSQIIGQIHDALTNARKDVPDAHFYICMEGGMEDDGNEMNETAYAVAESSTDRRATSSCSSFLVPNEVAKSVRSGKGFAESVNDFFKTNDTKAKGFMNILTGGVLNKEDHYLQPVIIALSTLLHEDWYN